jgi:O-antigen/teichoic acid export membrane protein
MLSVAVPAYSKLSDAETTRLRHRIVSLHACVLFPALALLVVTAPLLIPLVYGRAWEPAVPYAQLLAVAGFGSVITSGSGALLISKGYSRALGVYQVISLACFTLMVLTGSQVGGEQVCLAVVAYQAVNVACNQRYLMGRIMGIRWHETIKDIGPALSSSVVLAIVGVAITRIDFSSQVLQLCSMITACALAYGLTLKFIFREAWVETRKNFAGIASRTST